ncbi:MAG: hypothetical protein DRJ35_03370 [Thermoprotei archaeon]|nr:MAG: hypothetical protein DRJ35_03370 [Thermoprotei archaeon]
MDDRIQVDNIVILKPDPLEDRYHHDHKFIVSYYQRIRRREAVDGRIKSKVLKVLHIATFETFEEALKYAFSLSVDEIVEIRLPKKKKVDLVQLYKTLRNLFGEEKTIRKEVPQPDVSGHISLQPLLV